MFGQPARQLAGCQVAQLRRQGCQGHLAYGALVILRRELNQLKPMAAQGSCGIAVLALGLFLGKSMPRSFRPGLRR